MNPHTTCPKDIHCRTETKRREYSGKFGNWKMKWSSKRDEFINIFPLNSSITACKSVVFLSSAAVDSLFPLLGFHWIAACNTTPKFDGPAPMFHSWTDVLFTKFCLQTHLCSLQPKRSPLTSWFHRSCFRLVWMFLNVLMLNSVVRMQ